AGLVPRQRRGVRRGLVEEQPWDGYGRRSALGPDLRGDVRRDRLTFAIGVGRDENFLAVLRGALELSDRLLFARDRHELRPEALLDVDPELFFGEVHDVADRRADAVSTAEVLANGLRLGRRFHDDERGARARIARAGSILEVRVVRLRLGHLAAAPTSRRLGDGSFLGRTTLGAADLLGWHSQCTVWFWSLSPRSTNPAPSISERRSSSAMRPSISRRARSMMCSSSDALRAPEPVSASRCPHASGANRPRSCGPSTR